MVTRVAKAMFDVNPGNEIMTWDEPEVRNIFINAARAAIEAIECTPDMIKAGAEAFYRVEGQLTGEDAAEAIFRAMLDATLKDEP